MDPAGLCYSGAMKHQGSSSYRWLAALLILQASSACSGEGGRATPTRPIGKASAAPEASADGAREGAGDVPAPVGSLRNLLTRAGIVPTGIVKLESRQELPGCPEAELRYRFFLADHAGFFNASMYRTSAEAQACRDDFQAMALKGGSTAWERLQRDVFVQGSWLILFPPERPTKELRDRILSAIGADPGDVAP
ncbi:MAG TPA: hypothetical protein VGD74_00280 [Vulgatibacter sp.]